MIKINSSKLIISKLKFKLAQTVALVLIFAVVVFENRQNDIPMLIIERDVILILVISVEINLNNNVTFVNKKDHKFVVLLYHPSVSIYFHSH